MVGVKERCGAKEAAARCEVRGALAQQVVRVGNVLQRIETKDGIELAEVFWKGFFQVDFFDVVGLRVKVRANEFAVIGTGEKTIITGAVRFGAEVQNSSMKGGGLGFFEGEI